MLKPNRILTILFFGLVAYAGIKIWSIEPDNTRLIVSDGRGYYTYLPAILIYQDLEYDFLQEINSKYWENKPLDVIVQIDGETVNKCTAGVAVLWIPFFLIAHFLAILLGWEADGYSAVYQITMAFSALVYLYLGLLLLVRIMKEFQLKEWAISLSLVLIVLGTNLLHYSVHEIGMSHVYSFFAVSGFMYFAMRWLRHNGALLWVAVFLAVIMLIRPTNILVLLLLPFLAGGWKPCWQRILDSFKQPKGLVVSLITGFLLLSIQLWIYKAQTGNFLVDSYGDEGFNFLTPELYKILFGFRKGLFLWTPLIFISLFGIFGILKRSRWMALSVILFVVCNTYLFSAWHMWYFGGSFGHRAFIDMYPVFAIMLGFLFSGTATIGIALSVFISCFGFLPLNLFQTYQFKGRILPFDKMTKEKYGKLWMETDHNYAGVFDPYAKKRRGYRGKDSLVFFHSLDHPIGWGNESLMTTQANHSGVGCAVMEGEDKYGVTFRKKIEEISLKNANILRVSFWAKAINEATTSNVVISQRDSSGKIIDWQVYPVGLDVKGTGRWQKVSFVRELSVSKEPTDELLIYIVKKNPEETLYYDGIDIRLIEG